MWATTLFEQGNPFVQWGIVLIAVTIAAITDLSSRRIPNWLTGPTVLAGLVYALALAGVGGLLEALLACVLLAFPFVLLFLFARGGAGDAKLMGAVGAWLGLVNGTVALGSVAISGILLALVWAACRRDTKAVAGNLAGIATGVFLAVCTRGRVTEAFRASADPKEMAVMPYGVAIFVGVGLACAGVSVWQT